MFAISSDLDNPSFARLLPDDTLLMGENLGAPIMYNAVSGSSIVLLLRAEQDDQERWDASQRPVLVELTPDGGTRRREIVLPEPGWFGRLSGFGYNEFGVQITPEYDHLLYKTESALMLSSFPRQ